MSRGPTSHRLFKAPPESTRAATQPTTIPRAQKGLSPGGFMGLFNGMRMFEFHLSVMVIGPYSGLRTIVRKWIPARNLFEAQAAAFFEVRVAILTGMINQEDHFHASITPYKRVLFAATFYPAQATKIQDQFSSGAAFGQITDPSQAFVNLYEEADRLRQRRRQAA